MMKKYLILFLLMPSLCWSGGSRDFEVTEEDYITVTDAASLDMGTSDFTVAAWFKTESNASMQVISCKAEDDATDFACSGNDSDEGFRFDIDAGGTDQCGFYIADSSTSFVDLQGVADVMTGWHFCLITFDRNANGTIYVDDMATVDEAADISSQADSISSDGNLEVGRRARTGGNNNEFDGLIAHYQLWKGKLLNESERWQAMHCPGSVVDSLSIYLPLWEPGSTYVDLSGNGNDGSNTGTVESSDGPPISNCGGAK